MEKTTCPKCGATCVAEITNAKKCNQCGAIFSLERDPIGRRARAEKRGLWTARPVTAKP